MSTPELCLRTRYVFDGDGRIVSTRPPSPGRGPAFILVRGAAGCAWAIHADVAPEIAREVESLAREEPPISDLRTPPVHAERYMSLVGGELSSGPAFTFPETLPELGETETVDDLRQLQANSPAGPPTRSPTRRPSSLCWRTVTRSAYASVPGGPASRLRLGWRLRHRSEDADSARASPRHGRWP